jgi:hypothetical protein
VKATAEDEVRVADEVKATGVAKGEGRGEAGVKDAAVVTGVVEARAVDAVAAAARGVGAKDADAVGDRPDAHGRRCVQESRITP